MEETLQGRRPRMYIRLALYRFVLPSVAAWVMAMELATPLAIGQTTVRFAPGGGLSTELPPSQVLEGTIPSPVFGPPPLAGKKGPLPPPAEDSFVSPDVQSYEEALARENCTACTVCDSCCSRSPWFGSVSGLVIARNHANRFITTVDAANPNNALLSSNLGSAGLTGGYQVQVGRRFGYNRAVELTYWSLAPMTGSAGVSSAVTPGPLNAAFSTANLTFNGIAASDYFNHAHQQTLERRDLVRNLELNSWYYAPEYLNGSPFQFGWFGGFRWFQFNERLIFGSLSGGGGAVPAASNFGDNGGASEAYLRINSNNDLVGFQVGGNLDYLRGPRLRFYSTPMFGVYGNHMSQSTSIYTGNGINALASPVGGVPGTYPFTASKNDVSLLGQIDLGLKYQINERWRANAGYRIIGVSGIALGDHQMIANLSQYQFFQTIQSNGSLILHGGVFGLEANY